MPNRELDARVGDGGGSVRAVQGRGVANVSGAELESVFGCAALTPDWPAMEVNSAVDCTP